MNHKSSFLIYNASAGSGKTFSLVRDYLTLLFSEKDSLYFKHLLAITFTNKAVAEMKSRILDSLYTFSKMNAYEIVEDSLSKSILEAIQITPDKFAIKASEILQSILTNYALFSVETIDHFNHRLLRTFAKDLKISQNFEVHLDTPLLLAEAVNNLVLKAGKDPEITKWLIRFAIEKTEADKSWDIAYDLNKVAKMLLKEDDFANIEELKEVPLSDFENLKNKLQKKNQEKERVLVDKAQRILSLIHEQKLDRTHFNGGYLYDFLKKIADKNFDVKLETSWINTLGEKNLYPSRVKGKEAEAVEALTQNICDTIHFIKKTLYHILLNRNILQNIIPLATVHLIQAEIDSIKKEQNILPISEFNKIIHKEIKEQPAPFIYERLGERYKHFFIDEFQDTSKLQWQNLIPLIENPLVQETTGKNRNSLLLVGDAKQSIYRWRGGFPEQFMALTQDINPFDGITKEVVDLGYNFRSCPEIVQFNNEFFLYAAKLFTNTYYQKLYTTGTQQIPVREEQGFIQIDFLPNEKKEILNKLYVEKTLQLIKELIERGYSKESICVLVRKKDEGILISNALTEKSIEVASEETLLLNNNTLVKAAVEFLKTLSTPKNEEAKLIWLEYVHNHLSLTEDIHSFLQFHLKENLLELSKSLEKYTIKIDLEELRSFSCYEVIETFIRVFQLDKENDPFLTDFVNWVFKESQSQNNSILSLLENWEVQKDKLSLQASVSNAISVMTIHKSKGLEFPVVLFPFAEVDIYKEKDASTWYRIKEPPFDKVPIQLKKEVANYNEEGASLYQERRQTLELDNINLLYVALTRAQNELYIIGKEEKSSDTLKNYSQIFINYLEHKNLWQENQSSYSFGKKKPPIKKEQKIILKESFKYNTTNPSVVGIQYISSTTISKAKEEAIYFGNLLHDILSKIHISTEIITVFDQHEELIQNSENDLVKRVKEAVVTIVEHPNLQHLFNSDDIVYTERDVVTANGIIRPDRLNIHNAHSVTIIDYKTGVTKREDQIQINTYANVLSTMGYTDIKKILVYVNDHEIVVNKD